MTVKFSILNTQFKAKLADLAKIEQAVMPQLEKEFLKNTPIATGNARANTSLRGNVIEADYPYAFVLDEGRGFRDGQMRGSEQAPDGMSEPTKEYAKKIIPKVVQQISNKRK
jgi:hypothetical protein